MGAMASKKESASSPVSALMAAPSEGEVNGPVATITEDQSGGGKPSSSPRSMLDVRMRRQPFGDVRREGFAVHGERAAGRKLMALRRLHDERARAAHLLVEQADGVGFGVVGAEGVRADQLGASPGLVRLGHALGPHLVQDHARAGLRRLPRRLGAR